MRATEKVAVIGAGAAGLAAARQIALEGFEPVIFEAAARLGGTWVYTEELESDLLSRNPDWHHVHTSMYADLRTNLPRDLMAFSTDPSPLSRTPVSLFNLYRTWPILASLAM